MKKKRTSKPHDRSIRSLSLLLTLIMLTQTVSASAVTTTGTGDPAVEAVQDQPLPAVTDEPEAEGPAADITEGQPSAAVIGEEESRRNETDKHFRLEDGSYIAVSYGMPVHYQDTSGRWQEIDNTLSLTKDSTGRAVYQSENARTPAVFSASLEDGKLLTSSVGDVSVSMHLLDSGQDQQRTGEDQSLWSRFLGFFSRETGLIYDRDAQARVVEDVPAMFAVEESSGWSAKEVQPENLQSSVLYEDVFPGVDLQYTAYSYNIKEDIIVREPQDLYRYDFLLEMDGLSAVSNDDGSVSLLDASGGPVYLIPAPFMYDSGEGFSDAVSYTLTRTEEGTVLTVEADGDWINDKDREFPVTIDPTIQVEVPNGGEELSSEMNIYATYVIKGTPTSTQGNYTPLFLGYSTAYGANGSIQADMQVYFHFHNLPEIPAGSILVDARLNLYMQSFDRTTCSAFAAGLYEVTDDRPSAYSNYYDWLYKMCWNNKAAFDTTNMIDYTELRNDQVGSYHAWDLTELAKKWYIEGTQNRTVAMAYVPGDREFTVGYRAEARLTAYNKETPPVLVVSYRSNVGIEPYYTYTSLGVGNAGTAHIADESGQLKAAVPLVSYASTVNPVSVGLAYNSDHFSSVIAADCQPPDKLGLDMTLGHGWTLDIIQKMEDTSFGKVSYKKYTDGDGTVHYFVQDETRETPGTYYDEDGLGLKVVKTGEGAYTMTDDHGNTWRFKDSFLTTMTDSDGNQILIDYEKGRLTSVAQKNRGCGSITAATFGYGSSSNRLERVTDAAGNIYTLTYSDIGNLIKISRNDTIMAQYRYSGHRVTRMVDRENNSYAISFTYSNGKVASYQEVIGADASDTTGARVTVTYPDHARTLYRDHGADRTAKTSDDILTSYLFDYAGRTVNAYTTDHVGKVLGASNAVYTDTGTPDKRNNRTLRCASIGMAGQQLLRNTSFESVDSYVWVMTDTAVVTTNPRTGARSLKGSLSGSGTQSAKRITESLAAGVTYTFSAYVDTSRVTRFSGEGVYLKVTDNSTGTSWKSLPVNYRTSSEVDEGWVRLSVSFTPETSGAHVVSVYNEGAEGTFYADDLQLEQGGAPSGYNLVENGGMEMSVYGWTLGESAACYTTLGAAGSAQCLKIVSRPMDTSTPRAHQDITVNLPATQTYVLSGWVLANAVPDNVNTAEDPAQDKNKQCGLRAALYYTDGTKDVYYAPFNPDLSGWQFVSYTIVPKDAGKTVSRIRIICAYESNANRAYFDNISLVREAAQTMKYDGDGNLVSVKTPGLSGDVDTYKGGNLIKTVTGGHGTYEYSYAEDNKHRLTAVKGHYLTQSMSHDSMGNVLGTTLKDNDGGITAAMTTSAAYSGSGNLLTGVTDAYGTATAYTYGSGNNNVVYGIPGTITDAMGTKTSQTIDDSGRITKVSVAGTASVDYTYSNGNLTRIRRTDTASGKSMDYAFAYDAFGNMTSAKAGSRTLASYTYAAGNGQLESLTYGNGDVRSYTYDKLGRDRTVSSANGQMLTYTYSGDGQLSRVKETGGSAVRFYYYTYDSLGRLIASRMQRGTMTVLQTSQGYNKNGQLTEQSWMVGSGADAETYSEAYTYNGYDGQLRTMTTGTGETLNIRRDGLRRLESVTGGIYTKKYTYRDISGTRTTDRIETISYPDLAVPLTYTYTYDELGNIRTVSDPIDGNRTYTYDKQGQMLTEKIGSTTYSYTYDNAGNLKTAANSTGSHTYVYDHATWGDLLTGYDGQSISYDNIGNPTSYYNGTRWEFTWQNGRELAAAADGTTSIRYEYDQATGQRLIKTVGETKYQYYYAGGKLVRLTIGSDTVMDFCYDHLGQPYALKYNGRTYYYILNQQGDVVRIVSASGTSYGSYRYDAWGNILYATDNDLVNANPLRYRGYIYDAESGFYYVSSRYYDPEIGRFLNADAAIGQIGNIQSHNMYAYAFNNPVMYSDPDGNWPKLSTVLTGIAVGAAIVAVGALCVATGGLASVAIAGGGSMLMATATTTAALGVAGAAAKVAAISAGAAVVSKVAESSSSRKNTKSHTVYGLQDGSGKIHYVGRTTDVGKRRDAHGANPARAGLTMTILADNLSYEAARGVEQTYMLYHHTINTQNKMNNQINGISPKNKKLGIYMEAAKGALGYAWNQVSNEVLYWTGN